MMQLPALQQIFRALAILRAKLFTINYTLKSRLNAPGGGGSKMKLMF